MRVVPHPEPPGFALEVPLLPLRQALEKVASEIQAELPEAVVEVRDGNIWVDDEPVGLLGPSDKWRSLLSDPDAPEPERKRAAGRYVDAYLRRPIPPERWSEVQEALQAWALQGWADNVRRSPKQALRDLTLTALVEAVNSIPDELPHPLVGLYVQYKVGDLITSRLLGPDWRRKAQYVPLERDREIFDILSDDSFWSRLSAEVYYSDRATDEEREILQVMIAVTTETGRANVSEAHRRYAEEHPNDLMSRPTFHRRCKSLLEKLTT